MSDGNVSNYDPLEGASLEFPDEALFIRENACIPVSPQWRGILAGVFDRLLTPSLWGLTADTESEKIAWAEKETVILGLYDALVRECAPMAEYTMEVDGCMIFLKADGSIVSEVDMRKCANLAANNNYFIEAPPANTPPDGFLDDKLNPFDEEDLTEGNAQNWCASAEEATDYVLGKAKGFVAYLDSLGDSLDEFVGGIAGNFAGNGYARGAAIAATFFNFITSVGAGVIEASLEDPDEYDEIKCAFFCALNATGGLWNTEAINLFKSALRMTSPAQGFLSIMMSSSVIIASGAFQIQSRISYAGIAARIRQGANDQSNDCELCGCVEPTWDLRLLKTGLGTLKRKILEGHYSFTSGFFIEDGMKIRANGTPTVAGAGTYQFGTATIDLTIHSLYPYQFTGVQFNVGRVSSQALLPQTTNNIERVWVDGKLVWEDTNDVDLSLGSGIRTEAIPCTNLRIQFTLTPRFYAAVGAGFSDYHIWLERIIIYGKGYMPEDFWEIVP